MVASVMPMDVANRLLKPEVLARLGSLDLVARTVVDGVTTGLHRSPHFGFSQEFAEYRAYNEGDDLRYVDWNVYARTDRTYIKRFQGETNTAVTLLLDASASMGYGTPVTKMRQALHLVASLAYMTRKQHDALGLAIFDETVRQYLAPSARPDALVRTLARLERCEAGAGTDIIEALGSLRASMTRRGLVIVVSDLYADADELLKALQPLAHHGQDLAVFHVLDQQEIEPSMARISALRDLETDDTVIVDPGFLQNAYRTKFSAHCESVQQACRRIGADYTQVMSSEPLDAALQGFLRFRERRGR
ncbi:MAG: DUF58 domain-containing protein [Granulosicoccus sp.]|nr:DUF58 domain-containing protein [Granulosicoccus sp.]